VRRHGAVVAPRWSRDGAILEQREVIADSIDVVMPTGCAVRCARRRRADAHE